MKLYRIWQDEFGGYDVYNAAIVAAETADEARHISPSKFYEWLDDQWVLRRFDGTVINRGRIFYAWTDPDKVRVEEIGTAKEGTEAGLILASFNAG